LLSDLFSFDSAVARKGLVCSDPESFFQDLEKTNKNPLCGLRAFAVYPVQLRRTAQRI
jgi:hypothetical protein